jgi:hypothetical protein
MSIVSSIFTLKPIIDLLHEDVLRYANQIKELKERIAELEKENSLLKEVNSTPIKIEKEVAVVKERIRCGPKIAQKKIVINDDTFAKEAEIFVDPVNEVVENTEKVVTVTANEKTRKEYQQEYQRQYRKMKKEKQDQ